MRIVLASVLKPVTDPRLLARLGRTLAELPGAEVHIVAHVAADAPTARVDTARPNVFLHPVFAFPRLSLARARAGRTLLDHLRRIGPDVLVVGAAELLPAGIQWQRRTGGRLVYDVRENYALNVRTQGVFPPVVAGLLAARIARLEAAAAPHLSGALLAERIYAEQLPWLARCARVEVIENKYQPPSPIPDPPLRGPLTPDRPLRFLITGTLSELYGTFDAIYLMESLLESLKELDDAPTERVLHLVGHAPQAEDAEQLRAMAARLPWLKLTGIEQPVPHAAIIDAVRHAHIGLLPYRPHPSLDGCIPTKFWEYQAEGLPIVQRVGDRWRSVYQGIVEETEETIPRAEPSIEDEYYAYYEVMLAAGRPTYPWAFINTVLRLVERGRQNAPPPPPAEAFWATEAARLQAFFADLRQP